MRQTLLRSRWQRSACVLKQTRASVLSRSAVGFAKQKEESGGPKRKCTHRLRSARAFVAYSGVNDGASKPTDVQAQRKRAPEIKGGPAHDSGFRQNYRLLRNCSARRQDPDSFKRRSVNRASTLSRLGEHCAICLCGGVKWRNHLSSVKKEIAKSVAVICPASCLLARDVHSKFALVDRPLINCILVRDTWKKTDSFKLFALRKSSFWL